MISKGAPGIDDVYFPEYLHEHWPCIREALFAGTYQPSPVRRVEIPKPAGGFRPLGIPIVLDRLIQQAITQVREYIRQKLVGFYGVPPDPVTAR